MEGRKWEELNMDCLVNVFQRVGMESLLLDVSFVCKSWYKASLDPKCWVLSPRAPGDPRSRQMDGCATSTNIGS